MMDMLDLTATGYDLTIQPRDSRGKIGESVVLTIKLTGGQISLVCRFSMVDIEPYLKCCSLAVFTSKLTRH